MSSIGDARTEAESLADMVWANAERFGDAVSFRRRLDDSWQDITAREFAGQMLGVAKGLIATGLAPGDRVAVASGTRYEWSLIDFGVWAAGCVAVPIDAGARLVVADPERHASELTELGHEVDDERVHQRRLAVSAGDPASIRAGVEFSHGELLTEVRAMITEHRELIGTGHSMLICLPRSHPVAGVLSLACVYTRTTLAHSTDIADLATFRPTTVVAEASLLAEVHATAKLRAHAEDRGRIFDAAERVAVEHSAAFTPSIALRGKHLMAGRLVYPKVRHALGGRCTAVICVGAPPEERLARFFRGIGIPIHSS